MFLSQMAPQVLEVSPAPDGTIAMPVWLMSVFAALMIMMFFMYLARRSSRSLFTWLSLAFLVAAMVAASQTRFVGHMVQALDTTMTAALVSANKAFTDETLSELTTSALVFLALLVSLYFFRRVLASGNVQLQLVIGFLIGLLMISLSQSSAAARGFTSWILNDFVGGIMAGMMFLVGGGGIDLSASDPRTSVVIPVWFALAIFAAVMTVLFITINQQRETSSNVYRWLALISGTIAVLSASQAPIVAYLTAACEDLLAGANRGLAEGGVVTTTTWVAIFAIGFCLLVYASTRLKFVRSRTAESKTPQIIRGIAAGAIPLLLLILMQSSSIAVQVASALITVGDKGLHIVTGVAQAI